MTTVVVNDASCLIDLHKGRLLHAMLGLPFRWGALPFLVAAYFGGQFVGNRLRTRRSNKSATHPNPRSQT